MNKLFDDYFNIKKIIQSKKEYKQQMKRVNTLPPDYRFVYKKIQEHMWKFAAGAGYDMMEIHCDLLDLFEEGASEGKSVLEITGEDIANFTDELLKNTRTYTEDWKTKFNCEIHNSLSKK